MKPLLRDVFNTLKSIYIGSSLKYKNHLKLHWGYKTRNFGDILNPILLNMLTNNKAIAINANYYKPLNYLMIGSILQDVNKNSIVWGSGFISIESYCTEKPSKIYAVRGKLTRNKLLEQGIECPEVYGDPAILMPLVYTPIVQKKYKIGIIPHYLDMSHPWIQKVSKNSNVLIIDLITDNPLGIIDQINSCDCIASSSLHGLIISDTYKIPSLWIGLLNNIYGGYFKFHDYFSSIGETIKEPCILNDTQLTIEEVIQKTSLSKFKFDYDELLASAPFSININHK